MESVSVITIAYNPGEGLKRTLRTIQEQANGIEIESVIQDGGSTDGSLEILKEFQKEALFPVKLVSGRDGGIYDAMNRAVARCTKDWVIFMNAGDAFASAGILKRILQNATDGCDIIYGNAVMEDGEEKSLWVANLQKIEKGMPFCHQAALFRREVVQKFPFNTGYRSAADYDMLLRAYRQGCKFYNCKQTIATFVMDGISSTKYELAAREKASVLVENGFLPDNYMKTAAFKRKIVIAKMKAIISGMIAGKPVEEAVRNIYKRYIKHYEKLDKE